MDSALSFKGLRKVYPNRVEAIRGIDLEVKQGDFFALLGPNGAGKTTAINIVVGLVNKTSGSVSVFGKDIDKDQSEAKKQIGIVPQEFNFSIFEKPIDIVVQQAGFYGIPRDIAEKRAEKYLKKLDLWEKRSVQSRTLSGGMKRRLMIARALVHEPKLLILDEPTAGVDIEIRRSMWEFLQDINKEGTTIILTTHYLEEAEHLCKNVAIIDKGLIIKNTSVKNLLTTLDKEIFVFDCRKPLRKSPRVGGHAVKLIDSHTIEIEVAKKDNINRVFEQLSKEGVEVTSMRNKSNRLEELFLSLVGK